MKPMFVLLGIFALASLYSKIFHPTLELAWAGRIAMALMLIFTAIGHFAFAKGMAAMVPSFIPWKYELVIGTGILEVVFALGLLLPGYRDLTGWFLILFFILVLPANIKAALDGLNYQTGALDGPGVAYLWFRIPLQVGFIVWVYFAAVRG